MQTIALAGVIMYVTHPYCQFGNFLTEDLRSRVIV